MRLRAHPSCPHRDSAIHLGIIHQLDDWSAATLVKGGATTIRRSALPRYPRERLPGVSARCRRSHSIQLTAILNAAHTWRIRSSLRRPIFSTKWEMETLSTESRFTAQRRLMGSSPGSSTTSLGRLRTVDVHGAISERRRRGMAALRDSTTTGLLWMSGSSHHQSSPRSGNRLTRIPHEDETRSGCPTHLPHRSGHRHTPRTQRQSHLHD